MHQSEKSAGKFKRAKVLPCEKCKRYFPKFRLVVFQKEFKMFYVTPKETAISLQLLIFLSKCLKSIQTKFDMNVLL